MSSLLTSVTRASTCILFTLRTWDVFGYNEAPLCMFGFPWDWEIMLVSSKYNSCLRMTFASLHAPSCYGPHTRYVKLRVAHAPGMPGTFFPAVEFKGNRELAIPACITARAWRTCRDACRDCLPAGKTFPAFPAHAHPQFYVFGKRPMIYHAKTNLTMSSRYTIS